MPSVSRKQVRTARQRGSSADPMCEVRRDTMSINTSVKGIVFAVILLFGCVTLDGQEAATTVDPAYAGDRNVTGQCTPGAAPLTVYDTTSNTKIYLGSSKSIDQQGYFA